MVLCLHTHCRCRWMRRSRDRKSDKHLDSTLPERGRARGRANARLCLMSENLICVCFLLFITLIQIPFSFCLQTKPHSWASGHFHCCTCICKLWIDIKPSLCLLCSHMPWFFFCFFFNCRGKITSDNSQIKDEAEQNGREMDGQREREKRQQVCVSPEEREREREADCDSLKIQRAAEWERGRQAGSFNSHWNYSSHSSRVNVKNFQSQQNICMKR